MLILLKEAWYSDSQILEAAAVVGYFNYINTIVNALVRAGSIAGMDHIKNYKNRNFVEKINIKSLKDPVVVIIRE